MKDDTLFMISFFQLLIIWPLTACVLDLSNSVCYGSRKKGLNKILFSFAILLIIAIVYIVEIFFLLKDCFEAEEDFRLYRIVQLGIILLSTVPVVLMGKKTIEHSIQYLKQKNHHHNLDESLLHQERFDNLIGRLTPQEERSILGESSFFVEKEDGVICLICKRIIDKRTKAIRLRCSHVFDKNCLDAWIMGTDKCPICQFKIRGMIINDP